MGGGGTGDFDFGKFSTDTGSSATSAYIGALLGRYGTGTIGTGKMAARGQAAYAIKVQKAQFNRLLLQQNFAEAYRQFQATNPYELGFTVESVQNAPQKILDLIAKNTDKLVDLAGKKQTKKVLQKERKISAQIAARQTKLAPYTEVRVSELYGPNAGYWRERGAPPPLWLTQRGER